MTTCWIFSSSIFMASPRDLNHVTLGLLGGGKGFTFCLVTSSKFNKLGQELPTKQVSKWYTQPNQKMLVFSQCSIKLLSACKYVTQDLQINLLENGNSMQPSTKMLIEKFNWSRLQNTVAHKNPLSPKSKLKIPSVEVAIMPSPFPNPPQL